jgi:hypothetical protein
LRRAFISESVGPSKIKIKAGQGTNAVDVSSNNRKLNINADSPSSIHLRICRSAEMRMASSNHLRIWAGGGRLCRSVEINSEAGQSFNSYYSSALIFNKANWRCWREHTCDPTIEIFRSFERKHFFPTIESNLQKYASVSFWSASIASVGLLIQAIIPLQRDIQDVIAGTSPLRTQSIIHQTAALILFLAGYVHCISTDILVWKTRSLPNNAGSRWFKTVLTFLAISPFLISFVPHPASGGSGNLEEMTYGAIGQWICVLSLLLYFASYHFEFTFVRLPTTSSSSGNEGHDMNPLLVQRSTATD